MVSYSNLLSGGVTILMNNGLTVTCAGGAPPICAGKPDGAFVPSVPTARLKVRQAFAAAIDPVQLDARVFEGKGSPGSEFLAKSSPYYSGVAGPKYDPARAKQLVAQGKENIDIDALAARLQDEGAKAFVNSWTELMGVIASKSATLAKAS
jgi:hypothetical protein